LGILTPSDKQLAGEPRLQIWDTRQHHLEDIWEVRSMLKVNVTTIAASLISKKLLSTSCCVLIIKGKCANLRYKHHHQQVLIKVTRMNGRLIIDPFV